MPNNGKQMHTPGPWAILDEYPATFSNDGRVENVIEIQNRTAGMTPCYATNEADARFIVRACNAHDELVRCLENVTRLYVQLQGHETAYSREARAAIAKAREGK